MNLSTVLLAISLLVSLVACVAKTKRDKIPFPKNITLAGWLLAAMAVVTAAINVVQLHRGALARSVEESIALRRAEAAIYALMVPYTVNTDPPEMKDRFGVVESFGKAGVISGICDIDLSNAVQRVVVAPEYTNRLWGDFIAETTRDGMAQLREVQAFYGNVLSDEINLSIGELASHPWTEFMLSAKSLMRPNVKRPFSLARPEGVRQRYIKSANAYWMLLSKLETRIGRRYCALREELGLADVPPLFLRRISGYFFVPDGEDSKSAMSEVCKALAGRAG